MFKHLETGRTVEITHRENGVVYIHWCGAGNGSLNRFKNAWRDEYFAIRFEVL